jgi:TIR domain
VSSIFFSYSHVDEGLRDLLETHLSPLKRQGLISAWHDRRILAGSEFAKQIDQHLEEADVILLLVSPNFIASDYCYDLEMSRALEKHKDGSAIVIPVILRPCDWHDLSFGKLLAAPTDGKPISTWPNIDEAFQEVVKAIKAAIRARPTHAANSASIPQSGPAIVSSGKVPNGPTPLTVRSSNLRVKRKFTDLDRDRFRHEGFEFIAKYFEGSAKELADRNSGLEFTFRRIDANRFAAAIYVDGEKVCQGSASIAGGMLGSDSIEYSMSDNPSHGGMNEAVFVKSDDQMLFFQALGMQSYGNQTKLSFEGVAELFWELFIRPLQP